MGTATAYFDILVEDKLATMKALKVMGLLTPTQRDAVQQTVYDIDLSLQAGKYKAGECVPFHEVWEDLNADQRQQVIEHFRNTPIGPDRTEVLFWYDSRQAFRIERNLSPAVSR